MFHHHIAEVPFPANDPSVQAAEGLDSVAVAPGVFIRLGGKGERRRIMQGAPADWPADDIRAAGSAPALLRAIQPAASGGLSRHSGMP